METQPNTFIVGLFVLVIAILGTAFIVWFSKFDIGASQNLYYIHFDGSVTGLRENEDVLYKGIAIGKVKKIRVYDDDVQKVKVLVDIKKPEVIRENSVASIEAQGLTGYTFVQIKGSSQDSPVLKAKEGQEHPVIKSKESNLEILFSKAPKVVEDLSNLAKQLRKLFDDKTINHAQETFANLDRITTDLSAGSSSLAAGVEDFRDTAKSIKQTSSTLNQMLAENRAALNDFTSNGLPAFTVLAKKMQNSSDQFNRVIGDIEKSPMAFLHKNSNQGYAVQ